MPTLGCCRADTSPEGGINQNLFITPSPCGWNTALAVSSSVGSREKGFCKLRKVHELAMESPYPSPAFPEQELEASGPQGAELQVAMGIGGGGMVSSGFGRHGIPPTSPQPWEIRSLLQEGLPAAGAGRGTWAVVMSCPSPPGPGWRGAQAVCRL